MDLDLDERSELHTQEKNDDMIRMPHLGMIFESISEARTYYDDYGRQEGFWVRTRSSNKSRSRSKEVTSVVFVCAHEGKYEPTHDEGNIGKNRRCSTVKGGCIANMRIKHNKWTNKWKVSKFNDDHNHKVVTPVKRMKMKSNKHMPKVVKDLTEAFHRENLEIGKVPAILGGEYIGFDKRDCYNHLRNVRHRYLEYGDAQSVLTYFRRKQAENPQFFYAIQCDENERATNFFWMDARSRMSYNYFGDVVTFDTTYRTNKYDMPFAPFTGVNHHYQTIQFGCALLQDETELTFNLQTHEGTCECKKFEFVGIPCRHILKLFVRLDIDAIPTHFILPRWKKEVNKFRVMDSLKNDDDNQVESLRLHHLCQESTKLACYASKSIDAYTLCIEAFKDLSVKLEPIFRISNSQRDMVEPSSIVQEHVNLTTQSLLLDPNVSQTKGRKKEVSNIRNQGQGIIKSGIELSMAKRKRKCNFCQNLSRHDKRNCSLNSQNKNKNNVSSESEGEDDAELEEEAGLE